MVVKFAAIDTVPVIAEDHWLLRLLCEDCTGKAHWHFSDCSLLVLFGVGWHVYICKVLAWTKLSWHSSLLSK
jgi:hypothetical protein